MYADIVPTHDYLVSGAHQDLFVRSEHNPILVADPAHAWESRKVYNPAATFEERSGKYHLFYRAVGGGEGWHSSIGQATSDDGEIFARTAAPALAPETALETRGVEDPRLALVEGRYFMPYVAYDGDCARLLLATSDDLVAWERHGEMLPQWNLPRAQGFPVKWDEARYTPTALQRWIKSGGVFSRRINGRYWMIFGDSNLWLASSADGLTWDPVWEPFVRPRPDHFDSVHVELGPAPIRTEHGWLVIYHGIDEKIVYRLGILLLDLNDPSRILYRSETPVFQPRTTYELSGIVDILPGGLKRLQGMTPTELDAYLKEAEVQGFMPKVAFCNGAVLKDGLLRIFYGASDSVICTAVAPLAQVLAACGK